MQDDALRSLGARVRERREPARERFRGDSRPGGRAVSSPVGAVRTARRGDDLSSSARALLQPFVERPTATESIWNAASDHDAGVAKQGALPATVFYDSCAQSGIDGTWISRRSASEPVRAWVRCIGQEAADVESERLLERTLALLHKLYAPMVGLMRPPVLDLGGGDDAIDIYVIDPDASIDRAGRLQRPSGYASTVRDAPATDETSSAFMLLPRSLFT